MPPTIGWAEKNQTLILDFDSFPSSQATGEGWRPASRDLLNASEKFTVAETLTVSHAVMKRTTVSAEGFTLSE